MDRQSASRHRKPQNSTVSHGRCGDQTHALSHSTLNETIDPGCSLLRVTPFGSILSANAEVLTVHGDPTNSPAAARRQLDV